MARKKLREIASKIPRSHRWRFNRRCILAIQHRNTADRKLAHLTGAEVGEHLRRRARRRNQREPVAQHVVKRRKAGAAKKP